NKSISEKLMERARMQNRRAIELQPGQKSSRTKSEQKTSHHHREHMQSDQDCGHVDGVAPHPGNWTIIIGGSDSEHALNRQRAPGTRKPSIVASVSLRAVDSTSRRSWR